MLFRFVSILATTAFAVLLQAQVPAGEKIDFEKAKQIHQKMLQGQKLTNEERAYLEKAIQAKKGLQKPLAPPKGMKPLTDMTADEKYKGEEGGLYGSGQNEPPAKHLEKALQQAKMIQPLDPKGQPTKDGKIVLISLGMSNTTQVFSQFKKLADNDAAKSPNVVIVDGAQGAMEAQAWAHPNKIPKAGFDPWKVLEKRLAQNEVTPEQVQVAWIKQARAGPASLGEFPKHAQELKGHMVVILNKLKERFPNLRIAYLSSRTYAGYATTGLNPEPYAYESAFVVRWLIQEQMKNEPALSLDKSPLLLWGPYLWSDGEKGRKSGDLIWRQDDFAPDGTHPNFNGQRKVAELLLRFMKNDATAQEWFARK
jgi:hypothetical protein